MFGYVFVGNLSNSFYYFQFLEIFGDRQTGWFLSCNFIFLLHHLRIRKCGCKFIFINMKS